MDAGEAVSRMKADSWEKDDAAVPLRRSVTGTGDEERLKVGDRDGDNNRIRVGRARKVHG